jgi:hypothetical protein
MRRSRHFASLRGSLERGGRGDACVMCERGKLKSTIPTFGDIKSTNDEGSGANRKRRRRRRDGEEEGFIQSKPSDGKGGKEGPRV